MAALSVTPAAPAGVGGRGGWLSPLLLRWAVRVSPGFAVSVGLPVPDPHLAGQIRAAQIRAIFRLSPLAMTASSLNAVIMVVSVWLQGALRTGLLVWAGLLLVAVAYYARVWLRGRDPARPASMQALRRTVLHGALFGAVWGALPAVAFAGAPPGVQLLIGCVAAGMMCGGGLVLATVPLAGWSYVVMMAIGSLYALAREGKPVDFSLIALLLVYTAVVLINLTWNGLLFVEHYLAEARLRAEVLAREQAQSMVARNQRMTALGELAGGIAHDFNNVMQSVAGSGELIGAHAADANRVSELCARLMQAAARGSSISRRLLAFSRQDALSAEPVDVEVLFEEAKDLLGHTLGSGIASRVQIDQDVHCLVADRLQLETVLVNLATNARDAMPDGGTLTLRAARDTRSKDAADPPLKAGPYIRLSVEDSGIGMDAETLSHAPDPFFTTKPKGQGTGLGLSMAKGFAEQSGGGFAMASQPGQGTVVTLWLPETLAPAVRPDPVMAMPDGAAWGGTHILFVDDDDLVRQTMVASLESAGFKASGARDAGEALEYFAGAPRVDALIADFSMPGMNGRELIRAVQARQPDLPAILLTGQMGEPADLAQEGPQAGRFVLMRKPVRGRELVSCVQSLLQAAN